MTSLSAANDAVELRFVDRHVLQIRMQDRASKKPFDPARKVHARIKQEAMARGLMVYPMGGTVDGRYGDHVLLAPPFISSEAELTMVVERLGSAMDAAIAAG